MTAGRLAAVGCGSSGDEVGEKEAPGQPQAAIFFAVVGGMGVRDLAAVGVDALLLVLTKEPSSLVSSLQAGTL